MHYTPYALYTIPYTMHRTPCTTTTPLLFVSYIFRHVAVPRLSPADVASTPGAGSDLAPAAYKYKYKQGYLDAGNDIDKAAVQSLAEAQTVCDGMLQCVGFTFQDAPFTTTVEQVTERNKERNKESNDGGAAPLELSDLDADTIAAGSEGSAASPLARKIYFKQSGAFTSNTAGWHAFVKDGKTGAAGVATDAAGVAAEEVAGAEVRCEAISVEGSSVQPAKMGVYKEAMEHREGAAEDGTPGRSTFRFDEPAKDGTPGSTNFLYYVLPEDKKATGEGNWMMGGSPGQDDGWIMTTDNAATPLALGDSEWQAWDGLRWVKEPTIVLSCADASGSAGSSSAGSSSAGGSSENSGGNSGSCAGSSAEGSSAECNTGSNTMVQADAAVEVEIESDGSTGGGADGADATESAAYGTSTTSRTLGSAASVAAQATELRLEAALAEAKAGADTMDGSIAALQRDLRVYQAELGRLRSELSSSPPHEEASA
jgi:hypothetical protein